ncbi:hypothetical protein [Streptomyces sp. NBC_00102]|nr:hypothetical protein [Streptomyces sp. NBC_00102]MCX5401341.1 hypothetical protein [Streptomyces sp. NBC_00102]
MSRLLNSADDARSTEKVDRTVSGRPAGRPDLLADARRPDRDQWEALIPD